MAVLERYAVIRHDKYTYHVSIRVSQATANGVATRGADAHFSHLSPMCQRWDVADTIYEVETGNMWPGPLAKGKL